MRHVLRGAVLVCIACLVCPEVGAEEKWKTELNKHIQKGHVAQVEELLTDERLDSTGETASDWFRLVERLEKYSPFLLRIDGKTSGTLFDRVLESATKKQAANAQNEEYQLALAFATAARCRHLVSSGHKKAQPEWRTAANTVAKLYGEEEASADDAIRAAAWLGEAAAVRGESDKELLARAKEILDAVAAKRGSQESIQVALGQWYVARARAASARKSKSAGKAAVKEGLAFLKSHLGCTDPAPALVTVHSDLLVENWACRFGVKAPMRLKTVKPKASGLTFLIPESTEWVLVTDHEKSPGGVVMQRMHGGLMRRNFHLQSWKADGNIYVDRDQTMSTPVGNTKKLAAAMLSTLDQYCGMAEVTKRHKPRKAKLHKDFTDVWHIAVEGVTNDERWIMANAYYFTPKKAKRVYSLQINEFQPETTPDPAARFVLMNIQRTGK